MKHGIFFGHKKTTAILVAVFFVGLSLLLYPIVSDYWNSLHQSEAVAAYVEATTDVDKEDYKTWLKEAQEYNASLLDQSSRFQPGEEEQKQYEKLLDISGRGIIGYIEIPKIDVMLPIYHGVDEEVLKVGIGHIEGSSLPIGGEDTHAVISGHRGLPSSKLFTDLDQMKEGDFFLLYVLDQTLTYEVDEIHIVEPEDLSFLGIEEGEDLCTLITCTPYGVNSHRLLVRGHRVENQSTVDAEHITADAMQIDPKLAAPVLAVPILLVLLLGLVIKTMIERRKEE